MKTSQQIAEEMVCYAENTIAQRRPNYNNLPIMDREVSRAILLLEIPLTQLIEIARAANEIVCWRYSDGDASGNHHINHSAIIEIQQKLDVLRATGKAEWL